MGQSEIDKIAALQRRYRDGEGVGGTEADGFVCWLKECVKIQSGDPNDPNSMTTVVPFILWPMQEVGVRKFFETKNHVWLKARQLGATWVSGAFFLWRSIYFYGGDFLIVSLKDELAQDVIRRIRFMYDYLPKFLRPKLIKSNTSTMEFDVTKSRIQAIPTTPTAGRSSTLTGLMLDECAAMDHVDEIMKAAGPTLQRRNGWFLMISTANGFGNQFQKTYSNASRNIGRFTPFFMPWTADPTRTQEWYEDILEDRGQDYMSQEYPRTAKEAFLATGRPYFELAKVDEKLMNLPISRKGYIVDGDFMQDPNGILQLFHKPEKNRRYVVFFDVSEGLEKGDWSVGQVEETGTGRHMGELRVKCDLLELQYIANELGEYFNTALLVIESNNHGHAITLGLREIGYPNLYYDRNLVNGKITERPGFNTNMKSRKLMLAAFQGGFRASKCEVSSQTCLDEMGTFIYNKVGKPEAQEGFFDDCVMARAGAHFIALKVHVEDGEVDVRADLEADLGINIPITGLQHWAKESIRESAERIERKNSYGEDIYGLL